MRKKTANNPAAAVTNAESAQLKWGPLGAVAVTAIAYAVAQLILFLPLALIALCNRGQDVQTILENSAWLQLVLTGISAITLMAVLWLFLRRRKNNFAKDLGFKAFHYSDIGWVVLGLVAYYIVLIVALSLANLIPGFDLEQSQTVGYTTANGWQLGLAFIGLVVLPPLAEETLFRGFLYRGLASRWPKLASALVASLLFAVVHWQWNVGVDVFILSMVMIALYEKTRNLWVCVALHSIKNLIAFLVLFVFKG